MTSTKYQIADSIVDVPVARLFESPEQKAEHPSFNADGRDALFVADIARNGILLPITITKANEIRDGWRRWNAAKLLKLATIRCQVLIAGDPLAAFHSAQLARPKSVFSVCIRNRLAIQSLVDQSNIYRATKVNSPRTSPLSSEQIEEQWTLFEACLGMHRKTLQAGVRLLTTLENMSRHGGPEHERSNRIAFIFREHGLQPAMRQIDADAPNYEDALPDVGESGRRETKEQMSARGRAGGKKSGAVRKARQAAESTTAVATLPAADGPPISEPPKTLPAYAPDAWRQDCFKALATLEKHLTAQGRWIDVAKAGVTALERIVSAK